VVWKEAHVALQPRNPTGGNHLRETSLIPKKQIETDVKRYNLKGGVEIFPSY
jgi:hypothetical protein